MGFWAAAAPIAGGLLGGLGGKSRAKQSKQPTRTTVLPPSQLGGWGKLQEILKSLQGAPQYRPGAFNPYLQSGMQHIFGRAGIDNPVSPVDGPGQLGERHGRSKRPSL